MFVELHIFKCTIAILLSSIKEFSKSLDVSYFLHCFSSPLVKVLYTGSISKKKSLFEDIGLYIFCELSFPYLLLALAISCIEKSLSLAG